MLTWLFLLSSEAYAACFTGRVERIIDGDTVVLRTTEVRGQASEVRVRLAEIDAPEIKTEHGPQAVPPR